MIGCLEGVADFDSWDYADASEGAVRGAVFLRDFGVFKKGERIESLGVRAGDGFVFLVEYAAETGVEGRSVECRLNDNYERV